MLPDDIPALSLRELLPIVRNLKSISQRTRDTELAELTAYLISLCIALAELSTLERESFTVRPTEFAERHNVPLRTVQYWCRKGKVPAIRIDGRNWRIRDE